MSRPDEGELFAKHREAELAKAAAAEAKAAKVPEKSPSPENQPGKEAGRDSSGTDAPGVKSQDPSDGDALDLSFLPEAIRSKVHFDDKDAFETVKSGWMAKDHHSRMVNELKVDDHAARNWKAATAEKTRARAITSILQAENFDEEAERRVIAATTSKSEPAPKEDEPPSDYDVLDPKARQAEIQRQARKIAREEIRVTLETLRRPEVEREATNAALDRHFRSAGIPEAIAHAAMDLYRNDPSRVAMNPETAAGLVGPYVELAKLKAGTQGPATNPPAANGGAGLAGVASPTSRGGTTQPQPVPLPKHIQENRAPRTQEELEEEMLYAVRKRVSPSYSKEALRAAT